MGSITRFNLFDLYNMFGVRHFVETGTGKGEAIAHIKDGEPAFKTLLSCEIDEKLSDEASSRFVRDLRVHVFNTPSEVFLGWVCSILPYDEPILFWLDAHFPGADYGIASYTNEANSWKRLPLESELRQIFDYRPAGKDVIICDDLRIYVDGPFGHGNVPANVRPACPVERNIDFIHDIMANTHDIKQMYEHEGYVMITPKVTSDAR